MKSKEMRKSITEFLAGGLFALSVLWGVSLVIYIVQADSVSGLLRSLAKTSADISSPVMVTDPKLDSESDEEKTLELQEDENEKRIYKMISELDSGSGWGMELAPFETEEPMDEEEKPSSGLEYPKVFNSDGGRIIRRTYSYSPTSTCIELPGGGMLRNSTDVDISYIKEQVSREPELDISLDGEPVVLIMHTHTTECYEPYARERYDSEFSSRTTDLDKSVCAVGEEIALALEAAGIGVIHDTTVHDYPNYTGAYDRSSKTVEEYLREYPSIKIVLDIHRDAIETDGERYAPVCTVDGEQAAQIMIICGCMNVPQYRYNLRFASKLQSKLERDYPGLTRPILFANRNYNQELTHGSILIEMGSSSNSLEEAKYSGRLVGMGLAEMILNDLGL